ncbi:hypothetical protein BV898_04415 [Hypsibius exemplaris]|uniref:Folate receptor-like domain-containing protein n=1 Tax=Hypsibius exemplaris TaxID=2072580 RepID=A0A1W0X217_HYPEX|nr:hypothetical protein BV898_04415 [Hypsibius exemplaris]
MAQMEMWTVLFGWWCMVCLGPLAMLFRSVGSSYASFGDFNPTLIRPLNASHPYCSYFQNRVPLPAPELRNCSWYKKESCCRQVELDAIFKDIKPIQGADDKCQQTFNFLICWVCDPTQNSFYSSSKQKLTLCESFCDQILDACKFASFKGKALGESHDSGRRFCEDHNFVVPRDPTDRHCFSLRAYGAHLGNAAVGSHTGWSTTLPRRILFLLFSWRLIV